MPTKPFPPQSNSLDPTQEPDEDLVEELRPETPPQKLSKKSDPYETIQDILSELRKYREAVNYTRGGLTQALKVVTREAALIDEIESRLRTTRTTKRDTHIDAIFLANEELTKVVSKTMPSIMQTLSSFTGAKPIQLCDSFAVVLSTLHPETKRK